ncbi:MAG: TetR/AcrR family transcriptional regulator [Candidatus Eremiobacteraeota bacterium]|nr:TetR/AcrR family transcriptional regulator [Candidatus Eremiobacteraeota bacterium]
MKAGKKPDRRVARTRALVLGAFYELIVERNYDGFGAGDVIERAGVGRSTFYEHFQNKDDVFEQSVAQPLGALAEALFAVSPDAPRPIAEHMWEQRELGRVVFNGAARLVMERVLARLLAERLEARRRAASRASPHTLPSELVSAHLAGGQLALIAAWIGGDAPCDAATVARALHTAARAAVDAFF